MTNKTTFSWHLIFPLTTYENVNYLLARLDSERMAHKSAIDILQSSFPILLYTRRSPCANMSGTSNPTMLLCHLGGKYFGVIKHCYIVQFDLKFISFYHTSILRSYGILQLVWEELIFPIFVQSGTHRCLVDRGGMVGKVLPLTSTDESTSVIRW